MSRILCKKLGGPLSHSPARPALRTATSSQKAVKPGAVMKRGPPRQVGRTLERVLTDEKTCRRRAHPLSRSATDSVLPNLKREPSDSSLANVSLNRSAFHKSKRYSQREVDLSTVTQAAEAKAKKKANVEQELQGAIAALKRPNPRMAVKEFVEAAEQRAVGAKSKSTENLPIVIRPILIAHRIPKPSAKSIRTRCADHGHTKRQPTKGRVRLPSYASITGRALVRQARSA